MSEVPGPSLEETGSEQESDVADKPSFSFNERGIHFTFLSHDHAFALSSDEQVDDSHWRFSGSFRNNKTGEIYFTQETESGWEADSTWRSRATYKDGEGNLLGVEETESHETYDSDRRPTSRSTKKIFDSKGEYLGHYESTVIGSRSKHGGFWLNKVYEAYFDKDGNKIEEKTYPLPEDEEVEEEEEEKEKSVPSGGVEAKKAPKNEDGPNKILEFEQETVEYQYDKKGRKIAERYRYQNGNLSRTIEFQRDDSGRILRILFRDGLGKIIREMIP